MAHNKNVESSSKFKGHRHLSWATNDTRRLDSKVYQEHPTPKTSRKENDAKEESLFISHG